MLKTVYKSYLSKEQLKIIFRDLHLLTYLLRNMGHKPKQKIKIPKSEFLN